MNKGVAVPCPRCGRPWIPWANSVLTCHARCYFPSAVQDDLLWLRETFPVSMARLAFDFGVPEGVVKSSIAAARAGRKVARWGR